MSSPPASLGNPDAPDESRAFGLRRADSEHTGHDKSSDALGAPRIPSYRSTSDPPKLSSMSSSSNPLGVVNNARRPAAGSTLSSGGLPQDMQAKMRAFHLSRQGTPPAGRPKPSSSASSGLMPDAPSSGLPGIAPGALRMSIRPPAGPGFSSAPSVARPGQKPSLSQRRNMPKLGGLPGSPAAPPSMKLNSDKNPTNGETGSMFDKFSKIVDTKNGTLRFEGKAILHGGGVDFSTGSNFSISLDEVDTIEELGKGNYGTVYKVRHARPRHRRPGLGLAGMRSPIFSINSSEDEPVDPCPVLKGTTGIIMAMKEIRLELDEAKFAAIIMELDILHRCVSPYIIDFYGAFFQEGAVYICIEFMDGGSVDKLYGHGIPENVLRKIAYATTRGLKELKDVHNIIHRDVKPTNILVNTRGQIKICDFGVSGNLVASIAKTNIGCQSYMAPERISGGGMSQGTNSDGTYSVQSDIWSLGLSIIECAMGQYPYPPETYSNIFSQLSAIVDGEPPDLPEEGFSPQARDFVRSCLHKIPKLRPTYSMLLKHPWLNPLSKPATITEDDEEEDAVEAAAEETAATPIGTGIKDAGREAIPIVEPDGGTTPTGENSYDKEVAEWAQNAIERKKAGKMGTTAKPALHAAPLDSVSPGVDRG